MTANLDSENNRRKPRKNKWRYIVFDLPGWDSLDAVTRYHRWAEIIGIVVLALLVAAELASYRYGQRKDDLTTKQQEATDQRHDEEMARLHLQTAALENDNLRLQKELSVLWEGRDLTTDQINRINGWLHDNVCVNEKFQILWNADQPAANKLARQLAVIFRDAVQAPVGVYGDRYGDPTDLPAVGVDLRRPTSGDSSSTCARHLADIFRGVGIEGNFDRTRFSKDDSIEIHIGAFPWIFLAAPRQ
jgi:hypothetical protein